MRTTLSPASLLLAVLTMGIAARLGLSASIGMIPSWFGQGITATLDPGHRLRSMALVSFDQDQPGTIGLFYDRHLVACVHDEWSICYVYTVFRLGSVRLTGVGYRARVSRFGRNVAAALTVAAGL